MPILTLAHSVVITRTIGRKKKTSVFKQRPYNVESNVFVRDFSVDIFKLVRVKFNLHENVYNINYFISRKRMNMNRHVLRPTQNRLPLKDVSSQKYTSFEFISKPKLSTNTILQQQQQENLPATVLTNKTSTTRPILTAIRSLKQQSKENDQHSEMLISPMVKTNSLIEQNYDKKTREQLEQDLYEL